jgi:hypothetical protein
MSISSERYWNEKDEALRAILRDFPELWAVYPYWSAAVSHDVRVSQDMSDLKLALAQQSTTTRFVFWYFSSTGIGMSGGLMQRVDRGEGQTWAEVVWKMIRERQRVFYLFLVGAPDKDYATEEIVIFRNPAKEGLEVVVGSTVQLLGSQVVRGSAVKNLV